MNLQKKLDLIEQYRTCINFLSHLVSGIEYSVTPASGKNGITVNIEVNHETKKITARER